MERTINKKMNERVGAAVQKKTRKKISNKIFFCDFGMSRN